MGTDYTHSYRDNNDYILCGLRNFGLADILECGQSFRWDKVDEDSYRGIALGHACHVTQRGDRLIFHNADEREFLALWHDYFDLGRDYGAVKAILEQDETMRRAIRFAPGMRVLRQDAWEALCSFILSQNNNIPRIRGLVRRLCEELGDPVPGGGYSFPEPERLARLSVEDLRPIRSGFRAGYILDASRMVASGQVNLDALRTLDTRQARETLKQIRGVGPKVADCALLYGLARVDCLPEDVWIGRALKEFYPHGLPPEILPVAGLAQQYLFHFMRHRHQDNASHPSKKEKTIKEEAGMRRG